MADIKLVGAVAIKVRPNAKGFRGETQRQVSKELAGVEAQVKVKVEGDTTELKRDVDRAKKAAETKEITLKVGMDYDSVRRAQQQLDKAVKGLSAKEITVKLDADGIQKAQDELDEIRKDAQVEMTFIPDEKGYKAVLDKIAEIRRQKLEQEISFSIDEDSLDDLERDMRAALNNGMAEQFVTLSYGNNRESIAKAIKQIDDELDKIRQVEFDVSLDRTSLRTAREALEAALADTPVELKVDYDDQESLKRTRQRLREMLSELNEKTLNVAFNEEALRAELHRIDDMIKDEVEDKKREVNIPVHTTGLQLVARQLQFASRARRVPFHVLVDQKSMIIAEGLLRSLAGINTLQSAGRGLESLITKFDTIALKSAGWSSAIGGIADSLVYLVSSAFAVGDGMFEVVGLLATMPTALAAVAAATLVGVMAFEDFHKAATGDDKALAKLPDSAQKAARALRGTWEQIQQPVQKAFWDGLGDSIEKFAKDTVPVLKTGLTQVSDDMGAFFGGILDSMHKIAQNGDLQTMFTNLEAFFQRASRASEPFFDAFNTLGLRGSEFLPRFGDFVVDITNKFHDWIEEADRVGDITAWINDGTQSLKDMWNAAGAIIDQFKAIARATDLIGNNGLDDFRRSMEYIAKIMLAEPFQSKLGSVFFGARRGATELNKGVKDLAGSFADAAAWTGQLLTLLGRFGGDVLSGFSRTFANLNFQTGVLEALRGMSDMVNEMNPAFDDLGNLLGNIGRISSSVFRGLGPVFNSVLDILDNSVDKITDNLVKIAPGLLTLTNNMLNFARGPISLTVDILNAFLGILNSLPGPLRDTALAFGAFLLLRNQFGAFATSLNKLWTGLTTSAVNGAKVSTNAIATLGPAFDGTHRRLVTMADGSVRQVTRFGDAVSNGMARARGALNSFQPNTIVGRLRTAAAGVAGVVGRINNSLALIGGVPGLILGGIGVAMSVIGGNAADAAAQVDRLRDSLDKRTGAATEDTLTAITSKISEIDKATDAWANFWRGVILQSKAGNETIERLGLNIGSVAKTIAGSRGAYDTFIGQLKQLGDVNNLGEVVEFMKNGGLPNFPVWQNGPLAGQTISAGAQDQFDRIKKAAEAAKDLNLNPDMLAQINKADLSNFINQVEESRKQVELARMAQAIYAETLGVSTERGKEVASIVQIIGDVSADAAGKIDAINRSLEILNKSGVSEQEARFARVEGIQAQVENAKAIAESIRASRSAIFEQNGLISEQSKAGRDLFKIMSESADLVKIQAQAAYDAAIKNGDTAAVAAEKAYAIVQSGDEDLKKIADGAGLTVAELRGQWAQFFGSKWELQATFSANTDNFLAGQQEAQRLGIEFNGQEFMAWLLANPDPANVTVEQVQAHMRDYAAQTFKARLDALPQPAQAQIADVIGRADAFARGDYRAVLEGYSNVDPAVQSAINSIMRMTTPNWQARLNALVDAGSLNTVESQLNFAARNRTAYIVADASQVNSALDYIKVKGGMYADGGILGRVAAFANGGITKVNKFASGTEQHIANIYRPSSMIRMFAEPETGGEAYIPLAVSKRPRSVSILAEVAKKFGYELTKTQKYADGSAGGHSVPTRTSSTTVTVGTINTVDPDGAIKKLRQLQRDALAVAGIN